MYEAEDENHSPSSLLLFILLYHHHCCCDYYCFDLGQTFFGACINLSIVVTILCLLYICALIMISCWFVYSVQMFTYFLMMMMVTIVTSIVILLVSVVLFLVVVVAVVVVVVCAWSNLPIFGAAS